MNLLITICARGGSKGIPGKNIKLLNGKPLIFYTLKTAEDFKKSADFKVDIVLSTDCAEIKTTVKSLNFDVITDYTRPSSLASDTAGKLEAIKDVKTYMENKTLKSYDYVLDMDVTSPLRTTKDLRKSLQLLEEDRTAYNIFSVSPANRNPYFNMVEEQNNGYFALSKTGKFLTRQSAPLVYDMNASFYIYRSFFFTDDVPSAVSPRSLVYLVPHVCFDLDHPIDFEIMDFLMENNKLDFELFAP